MPEDLTIAVIKGLDWAALRPYAVSLTRTGFTGTKLVLVEETPQEVRDSLTKRGFTVIDRGVSPPLQDIWAFGIQRFAPAIKYLRENPGRFRYVIWTDVRDLIFQSDPSVWLEQRLAPSQIVVAGLGHAIKDCPYNDPWVRACSPDRYAEIREHEALACGTFAGTADAILGLMQNIYLGCEAAQHPWATDQGMLNCLMRTNYYKSIARVPASSEAFSAQWFPAKNNDPIVYPEYGFPVFDKPSGLVLTPEGVPYSIVHLYDRDATWVNVMRQKYA